MAKRKPKPSAFEQAKYFTREEFGPKPDKVARQLVLTVDAIRGYATKWSGHEMPFSLHETWAESGHAQNSYHYIGLAADGHFHDHTLGCVFELLCIMAIREVGGIGFYPTWGPRPGWHIDLRDELLMWVWTGNEYIYGPKVMQQAVRNPKRYQ